MENPSLEKVDLKYGTNRRSRAGRADLTRYWGILGKASAEKLGKLEEEAQLR